MSEILLVSKAIGPPWNDGTKNLVRDLALHVRRHRAVVLGRRGEDLTLGEARVEPLYPVDAGGFAPAWRDRARVAARLFAGPRQALWHFFFAPNPASSRVAASAARLRGRPTIQTVCSAPAAGAQLGVVLFADRIVALSRHSERRLREGGVSESVLRRIAPAVPALAPLGAPARREARARHGLSVEAPLVVYPGDLEFSGGAERALRAHARLPASLGAVLVMACRAKTTRARARESELRMLARSLGIERGVQWLGEIPTMQELLGAADVVTLPAEDLYAKLDLPLSLLEAQALGRTVVVIETSSAAEIAEGEAAVAVPADVDAVAEATRSLLEDAASRAAIGARAREAVRTRHGVDAMAAAYEALYDELLG